MQNVSQTNRITGTILIWDYVKSSTTHTTHTDALYLRLYSRECTVYMVLSGVARLDVAQGTADRWRSNVVLCGLATTQFWPLQGSSHRDHLVPQLVRPWDHSWPWDRGLAGLQLSVGPGPGRVTAVRGTGAWPGHSWPWDLDQAGSQLSVGPGPGRVTAVPGPVWARWCRRMTAAPSAGPAAVALYLVSVAVSISVELRGRLAVGGRRCP